MSNDGINPNNNVIKKEVIMYLWYEANGQKFGKVNLETNQEVMNAILAGKAEYMKKVKEKAIPVVHPTPITVKQDQNVHIVTVANTHNFDISNPQLGVENRTNYVALKANLQDKGKNDKNIVFFTGNFVGKEWTINFLNNATIEDNKIDYYGLLIRLNEGLNTVKFAAKNGADQIFLMNGREEHLVKQKLNIDPLKEIVQQRFNDLLFEYIVQVLKKDKTFKDKKVEVAYVPGVKKVFNVVRTNEDKTTSNFTFSMHTNLKTTSTDLASNKKAAVKQHADLASADAILIQGENAAGLVDDDANIAILTGYSTYNNTTKGNLPGYSPKDKSSLTLLLGKKSHDVEIAWTMDLVNESTYPLERHLAELREKEEFLVDLCEQKIQEKHQKFARTQSGRDFNKIQKEMKKAEAEVENGETK